jgi:hypothetical protein
LIFWQQFPVKKDTPIADGIRSMAFVAIIEGIVLTNVAEVVSK